MPAQSDHILWFQSAECRDITRVGGKNASLAEMFHHLSPKGIAVPQGFATSTEMYREFLAHNSLEPVITATLDKLETDKLSLRNAGQAIRDAFLKSQWPEDARQSISRAYQELVRETGIQDVAVAVRSSATAEDLPEASFAGQQESYLNIRGEEALLQACKSCYASLFTDRAITYRTLHHFDHLGVALSIGIQQMVRSDISCAGVIFTLDTETGFDRVVTVTGVWGLGENIVQGLVDPDEFTVFKPFLDNPELKPIIGRHLGSKQKKLVYGETTIRATRNISTSKVEQQSWTLEDEQILTLARWACQIEAHYGCPMDIEWARDGESGDLFIVQARPETVQSQNRDQPLQSYHIQSKNQLLLTGLAVGQAVVSAPVCLIDNARDIENFVTGSILVTQSTDPDWVPIMKRAAAIITNHGGRTSHAAIVSRELGLPAVLGTHTATTTLKDGQRVSVSCAEGDTGFVYDGEIEFTVDEISLDSIPATNTKVMLNLANPATAFQWWRLPADGIGLVRMEFVINNHIKIHPMALLRFDELEAGPEKDEIAALTRNHSNKQEYFSDRLALGLARFAALYYPHPTIIRMSDFKTNEYAHLLGGRQFEPEEENPMLGFRGASRYYAPQYREAFALECQAIRKIRDDMGFDNVVVMIPFCRTLEEAGKVMQVMADNGLARGKNGLQIYVMCEIPSNVILARQFAEVFDGFSIGSNDLTQLTLGVDRDSSELAELFSEQNEAVKWMIRHAITEAHAGKAKIGLCGQAPSDHPEFADFLVECGIDSMSVTPDSFVTVKTHVAAAEGVGDK